MTDKATKAKLLRVKTMVGKANSKMKLMQELLLNASLLYGTHKKVYQSKTNEIQQLWLQIESIHCSIIEQSALTQKIGYDVQAYRTLENRVQAMINNLDNKMSKAYDFEVPKAIEIFDGNYINWPDFYNAFTEMIDIKPIPDAQKLLCLQTYLDGKAKQRIQNLTDYNLAWQSLCFEYNSIRRLTSAIIRELIEQPVQTMENVESLKSLFSTTEKCLQGLAKLNVDTQNWDPIVHVIVYDKLHVDTRLAYEETRQNAKELQSMQNLFDFIKRRINGFEMIDPYGILEPVQQIKVLCKVCKMGTHQVYQCKSFLQQTPRGRLTTILQCKLCHNCLKAGHMSSKCTSRNCKKCNEKHNTLLHIN